MAAPHRVPPAARVLPSRVFYGWYIALACAALMLVGVGIGYYGLAVFLRPLREAHGWSNSVVSGATGLFFSVSGIAAAFSGGYIDRRGPMGLMAVGSVGIGLCISAIGFVNEIWQLYAVYALLAVCFGATTSVGVNAIMTRWFVLRRARAMSVSSTGVSIGGVVFAPLGSTLINIGGLQLATPLMGLLVVAVALPVLFLVVVWDPAEMGLQPDGIVGDDHGARRPRQLSADVQRRTWTRGEAMRTLSFWAILVSFVLVLTSQTGFVIHQISFLEGRFGSRSAAALALSLTAFGSIVARLVVGTFADAVDKRWLTFALLVLQASAILGVIAVRGKALTYLLTLTFGFTIGNVYMMQSLLVGEVFGMVSFGAVFGLVSLATQVGSGAGPLFVGFLQDRSGTYSLPFTIAAVATYAAAFIVLLARPLTEPEGDGGPGWEDRGQVYAEGAPVSVVGETGT